MSCNGCRVLRKGCSEACILRPCLQGIESPEAQGHATVFVAKFFGRAGLMSFISAVPESQRPALFQSLLFEACGRTVNPVNGAVGLLWTGNWHVCQAAVETVLRGGTLRSIPELLSSGQGGCGGGGIGAPSLASDETSEICPDMWRLEENSNGQKSNSRFSNSRSKAVSPTVSRKRSSDESKKSLPLSSDLDLCLTPSFPVRVLPYKMDTRRPGTPSMNSEESVTTSCWDSGMGDQYGHGGERKLLNLFG